ncbi:MAG: hypothetical protein KGI97_07185 [Alphaproteobacteria bacterium]|nr:hypothetical protein [Alphaproteobacteria bacterium]
MKILARAALLISMLALAGCGFHPVYAAHGTDDNSPVAMDLNNVAIDNIPDRDGQILRNELIDRMYGPDRPEHSQYRLKVSIHSNEAGLGILANATATRALLNMYADYILTDAKGKILAKGEAHSVASFDLLDQMYGTIASRQDAQARTLHECGEQIVNRLNLYFAERP